MKLQETLEYLGLESLPKAGTSTSQKKMACLVERVTGVRDYAIAKNGGIVADLGFTSSIKKIIEFYPEPTKKEKAVKEDAPPVPPIVPDVPIVPTAPEAPVPEEDAPKELAQCEQDLKDLEEIFPSNEGISEGVTEGTSAPDRREQMIQFLEAQKAKRATLETKTESQLADMCKRFGKEF